MNEQNRTLIEAKDQRQTTQLEQERFNFFILAENDRLNRLIRNLYLHFQLEHYSERDLYDHICQEVAEYFRADCCALLLVRYEEEDMMVKTNDGEERKRHLFKWLELVGASGPWRRALKQQYIRQRSRNRYQLPGSFNLESVDSAKITNMTRKGFMKDSPTRYASAYDLRPSRKELPENAKSNEPKLREDSPRQVVWFQDGLYNSCRSSLMVPLVREGKVDLEEGNTPIYKKVGLIKLENRSPYGVVGFSDITTGVTNQNHLFFTDEWEITALRPYVRDLQNSVYEGQNPFLPLHNNVGWQQYFEDHPLGVRYFNVLLRELRQRYKDHEKTDIEKSIGDFYEELSTWIEALLECLIRLESWIQYLRYASHLLCGIGEKPSLDRPIPSFFNIYNLTAAFIEIRNTNPKSNYLVVKDAVLNCLTRKNEEKRKTLDFLEKEFEKEPTNEQLERKIEDYIFKLCQEQVQALRTIIGIDHKNNPFDLTKCFDHIYPEWNLQSCMLNILDELKIICESITQHKFEENICDYQLMREEIELQQISKSVTLIIDKQHEQEVLLGIGCASPKIHDDKARVGCRLARALTSATMYADSFNVIDEKRLVFIASHIAQILDNHLLHQARQRGIELDYRALDILGLEQFGLELLDFIRSYTQRIATSLDYLLCRMIYSLTQQEIQTKTYLHADRTLIEKIENILSKEDGEITHCLATIESEALNEIGTRLLFEIYHNACMLDLETRTELDVKGGLSRIDFFPSKDIVPQIGITLTQIILRLNKNRMTTLELLIQFITKPLLKRDLRSLWFGTKILGNVLKTVEVTTKKMLDIK